MNVMFVSLVNFCERLGSRLMDERWYGRCAGLQHASVSIVSECVWSSSDCGDKRDEMSIYRDGFCCIQVLLPSPALTYSPLAGQLRYIDHMCFPCHVSQNFYCSGGNYLKENLSLVQ